MQGARDQLRILGETNNGLLSPLGMLDIAPESIKLCPLFSSLILLPHPEGLQLRREQLRGNAVIGAKGRSGIDFEHNLLALATIDPAAFDGAGSGNHEQVVQCLQQHVITRPR